MESTVLQPQIKTSNMKMKPQVDFRKPGISWVLEILAYLKHFKASRQFTHIPQKPKD
jgi:hypothetical protein